MVCMGRSGTAEDEADSTPIKLDTLMTRRQRAPIMPKSECSVNASISPCFSNLSKRESLFSNTRVQFGRQEVVQLWASKLSGEDRTGGEVTPDYVSAIDRDLPVKPDYHLAPGAGHFAFIRRISPSHARTDLGSTARPFIRSSTPLCWPSSACEFLCGGNVDRLG
jgi:hypothetical protein